MNRLLLCTAALACGGLLAVAPGAAQAAPANGRIAYSFDDVGPEPNLNGHSQVYTVNPDGTDIRQLTHLVAPDQAGDPSYSPNGRHIAYASNAGGGRFQLWLMRSDGSRQHQMLRDPDYDAFDPSWSPDGTHLAFERCHSPFGQLECNIAVVRRDGTGLRQLTRGHDFNGLPTYSPDGRRIGFNSNRNNRVSALWRVNLNGSGLHELTAPDLEAFHADYAPDGSRILFTDNCCRDVTSHLYTMRPDGRDVRGLTEGGFGRYSPDGRQIVYVTALANGNLALMRADADGRHPTQILEADHLILADWGPQS